MITTDGQGEDDRAAIDVKTLREGFRNLRAWRAAYESLEVPDTLTRADGTQICLWDLEYLYSQIHMLSPRQRQSIELCLVDNVREKDAALMMGVSVENPVMTYATNGLKRLVEMIDNGELPRYQPEARVSVVDFKAMVDAETAEEAEALATPETEAA